MSDFEFTSSQIRTVAKIYNISEDEARKKLEQEQKAEEKKTIKPGSKGVNDRAGSLAAQDNAALQGVVNSTSKVKEYEIEGIKFTVDQYFGGNFSYKIKDNQIIFTGKKCTITIKELSNPDLKAVLYGQSVIMEIPEGFNVKNIASKSQVKEIEANNDDSTAEDAIGSENKTEDKDVVNSSEDEVINRDTIASTKNPNNDTIVKATTQKETTSVEDTSVEKNNDNNDLKQKFDIDGDGKYSAAEEHAYETYLDLSEKEKQKENINNDLKQKFDIDGDGKYSAAEEHAYETYLDLLEKEKQKENINNDLKQKFDIDGDGKYSEAEEFAYETYVRGMNEMKSEETSNQNTITDITDVEEPSNQNTITDITDVEEPSNQNTITDITDVEETSNQNTITDITDVEEPSDQNTVTDNMPLITISYYKTDIATGKTNLVKEELTFQNLYDSGYMIIGTGGAGLDFAPYTQTGKQPERIFIPSVSSTIPRRKYEIAYPEGADNPNTAAYTIAEYETNALGEQLPKSYRLNPNLTEAEYNKLDEVHKLLFQAKDNIAYYYQVSQNNDDLDIQTLLNSNAGQIVRKEFFDYLVSEYGYDYTYGISPAQYEQAIKDWCKEDSSVNNEGIPAVINWRRDTSGFFQVVKSIKEFTPSDWSPNLTNLDPENPQISLADFFNGKDEIVAEDVIALYNSTTDPVLQELLSYLTDGKDVTPAFKLACAGVMYDSYDYGNNGITFGTDDPDMMAKNGMISLESLERLTALAKNPSTEAVIKHLEVNRNQGTTVPVEPNVPAELQEMADLIKNNPNSMFKDLDLSEATDIKIAQESRPNGSTIITAKIDGKTLNVTIKADGTTQIVLDVPSIPRALKDMGLDLSQSETYDKSGNLVKSSTYEKFSSGMTNDVVRIDKEITVNGNETTIKETRSRNINGVDVKYITGNTIGGGTLIPVLQIGYIKIGGLNGGSLAIIPYSHQQLLDLVAEQGLQAITSIDKKDLDKLRTSYDVTISDGTTLTIGGLTLPPTHDPVLQQVVDLIKNNPNSMFKDLDLTGAKLLPSPIPYCKHHNNFASNLKFKLKDGRILSINTFKSNLDDIIILPTHENGNSGLTNWAELDFSEADENLKLEIEKLKISPKFVGTTITVTDPNSGDLDLSQSERYDYEGNLVASSDYKRVTTPNGDDVIRIDKEITVNGNETTIKETRSRTVDGINVQYITGETTGGYHIVPVLKIGEMIYDSSVDLLQPKGLSDLYHFVSEHGLQSITHIAKTENGYDVTVGGGMSGIEEQTISIGDVLPITPFIPAELEQIADLIKNNPNSMFADLDLSKATDIGITKEMKKIGSEETILISGDFIPVGYEETGAKIINAKIGDSKLTITIKADGIIGIEQITNFVVLGQNRPEDYPKTETYDKDGNLIANSYYEVVPDESGAGEPIKIEKTFTETDTTKTTTTTKTRTEWNSLYEILPTNEITPFSQILADHDIVKTPVGNKIDIQVVTEEVLDKTTGKVTTSEKFLINGVEIEAPQGFDLTKITKFDVSDNEYILTIKDAPRDMAGKLVAFDKVSGKQVEPNYVDPELQAIIENSKWKDYGLDLTNAIFTQVKTVPQGMVGGGENVRAWTLANGDVLYLTKSYSGLTSSSSIKLVQQRNIDGVNIEFESSVYTGDLIYLHPVKEGEEISKEVSGYSLTVDGVKINPEYGNNEELLAMVEKYGADAITSARVLKNGTIEVTLNTNDGVQTLRFWTIEKPYIVITDWSPNISNLDPENPQISLADFFNGKDEIVAEDVIALYNSTTDPVLQELLSYLTDGKDVTPAFKLACAGVAYDSYEAGNKGITNHTDDPDMLAKNGVITLESLERLTELAKNPSTEAVIKHLDANRAQELSAKEEFLLKAKYRVIIQDTIEKNPDSVFKDLDFKKMSNIEVANQNNGDVIITATIDGKTLNVRIKADGTTQIALDVPSMPRPLKDMGLDLSQSETYDKSGNLVKSSTYEKFASGGANDVVRIDKTITKNGDETTVEETRSRTVNGVEVQYITGQTTGDYRHINQMKPVLKIGDVKISTINMAFSPIPESHLQLLDFVKEHGLQSIASVKQNDLGKFGTSYDVTIGGGMSGIEKQTISIKNSLTITPFIPAELEQIADLIKNNPNSMFKDLDLTQAKPLLYQEPVPIAGNIHNIDDYELPDGRILSITNYGPGPALWSPGMTESPRNGHIQISITTKNENGERLVQSERYDTAGKIKETSNANYKNTENGINSEIITYTHDENGDITTTTKEEKTYGANSYYRKKTSITDNKTNITKTEEYKYNENNVLFEKIEEVFDRPNNKYDRTVTKYNANGEIESVERTQEPIIPVEPNVPAELQEIADLIKNNPNSMFKDLDLSEATGIQVAQEDRVNGDTRITAKIDGKTLNVRIKADGTTQIVLDVPSIPRALKDMGLDLSQSETYDKSGNLIKSSTYEKFIAGITNDVIRIDKTITKNGDETTVEETRSRTVNGVEVQYITGQTTGDYRHINQMKPVLKIGNVKISTITTAFSPIPESHLQLLDLVNEHGLQAITSIGKKDLGEFGIGYDITVGGGMTGVETQTISVNSLKIEISEPVTPQTKVASIKDKLDVDSIEFAGSINTDDYKFSNTFEITKPNTQEKINITAYANTQIENLDYTWENGMLVINNYADATFVADTLPNVEINNYNDKKQLVEKLYVKGGDSVSVSTKEFQYDSQGRLIKTYMSNEKSLAKDGLESVSQGGGYSENYSYKENGDIWKMLYSAATGPLGELYINDNLANGIYDGKLYVDGRLANGLEADNKYYQNGLPAHKVEIDGKMYYEGEIADHITINNKYYVDGNLANGMYKEKINFIGNSVLEDLTEKMFVNGEVAHEIVVDGLMYYRGQVATLVTINDKFYVAGKVANGLYFNKMYVDGKLVDGEIE